MRWLDDITDSMGLDYEQTLGDSGGQGSLVSLQSMGPQRVRHNLATEQQQAPRFLVVCYQTPRRLTRSLPGGARGHWPCWVNVGKGPLYQGS